MTVADEENNNVESYIHRFSPYGSLIIKLASAHRLAVTKKIRSLDLYPGQEMVLLALSEKQPCSQSDLSQHLCVDHSTVTTSLTRMEKSGLIVREKSSKDRRVTLVKLSKTGSEKAKSVQNIMIDIEKKMIISLSDQDKKLFFQITKIIEDNLMN
ncbi:MarR family winged helix-turn-helix transcriptional regulator [Leuconostoc pseudomesenteroides]|uniref:MarR family winged helix-turn-helix transcriptional regulator n=1 Tax=Leuconostoc pseudomesenteroides TaxID=33968 RepID=UPI0022866638|nr:MarR family transcriptional regulator [Leuconostoc pseudomesenteroides]WAM37650.1 MarR family transcriptional regulator [Leuconostoc pseudomesenteroides]